MPSDITPSPAPSSRPKDVGVRSAAKPCGECSLCCKVLRIEEMEKAEGVWCRHFAQGARCTIYADRPDACSGYQCTWTLADPLGDEWRPDRAGFVLHPGPVGGHVEIVVDPGRPDAWRREPFYSTFKRWSHPMTTSIERVIVKTRGRVIVVFPEADIDIGAPGALPNIETGYEMRDGRAQPFARWAMPAST